MLEVADRVLLWRHKGPEYDSKWPALSTEMMRAQLDLWPKVGEIISRQGYASQVGEAMGLLGEWSPYWTNGILL